jgi:hypothetical protein
MRTYRVKLTSETYAGRFIGQMTGFGLKTEPTLRENPPIGLPGTEYVAHVQERGASRFFEPKALAVQAMLQKMGINSEMIPVTVVGTF